MQPMLDRFDQIAQRQPERLAVADQSLMLTYAQLLAISRGLASQIPSLTEKQRIGVLSPTSAATAAAILACWYAGRIPVPLNFLLAPEELAKVIRDADLDAALTIERFAALAEPLGLRTLLLSAKTLVPGEIPPPPSAAAEDDAVFLYTSGTAGDPKGVKLSFDNLLHNADACIEYAEMTSQHVFLSVLPQFHSFGFTAMTVTPLLLGATAHYLPRFTPLMVIDSIQRFRVSVFMAIPSMYAALLHLKDAPHDAFATVALAISGGEPLSQRVALAFEERFGTKICEGYGLTETSPVVSLNTPQFRRLGSVGRALPGIRVCAADPSSGIVLPAGETGELVVSGHCVMKGYHNKPAETAAVLRDGRLWTGDVGHVDAEGYIYITGRAKEMIIISGENVFPREIESVLMDHPAVAEAAVIGARDDVRGEVPVAFVILREGHTAGETELREFCRSRIAHYKAPRAVRIAADLPRGPTGKILKRALRYDAQ